MAQAVRGGEAGGPWRVGERERGWALVREWRASGLSQAAFCRSRGVAVHRLQYWRGQSEGSESKPAPTATGEFFAAAMPTGAAERERGSTVEVEIYVRESVRVRVSLAHGPAALVQALRGVLEVLEA